MLIKILSFTGANDELFNTSIKIRFTVFSDEFNVDKKIEYDGLDFDATHFLVFIDDVPAATLRFRDEGKEIFIEKLAVLKQFRSLGIASLLIRHLLQDLKHAKRLLVLTSPVNLVSFFNSAGFSVQGEEFLQNGINSVKMIYNK